MFLLVFFFFFNNTYLGAGIVGVCTAYYLTQHPKFSKETHHITILEARRPAGAASGKAGGLLAMWAFPQQIVPLSFKLHEELAEEYNGATEWGYRGLKTLCIEGNISSSHLRNIRNGTVKANPDIDLPEGLDWISPEIIDGWTHLGGADSTAQVHPYKFTLFILKKVLETGAVDLITGKVTGITSDSNGNVNGVSYTTSNDKRQSHFSILNNYQQQPGPQKETKTNPNAHLGSNSSSSSSQKSQQTRSSLHHPDNPTFNNAPSILPNIGTNKQSININQSSSNSSQVNTFRSIHNSSYTSTNSAPSISEYSEDSLNLSTDDDDSILDSSIESSEDSVSGLEVEVEDEESANGGNYLKPIDGKSSDHEENDIQNDNIISNNDSLETSDSQESDTRNLSSSQHSPQEVANNDNEHTSLSSTNPEISPITDTNSSSTILNTSTTSPSVNPTPTSQNSTETSPSTSSKVASDSTADNTEANSTTSDLPTTEDKSKEDPNSKEAKKDKNKNSASDESSKLTTHHLAGDQIVLTLGPWTSKLLPSCPISGLRAHSITIQPSKQVSPFALFTEMRTTRMSYVSPEIYPRRDEVYVCGEGDTFAEIPETSDDVEILRDRCDELFKHVGELSPNLKNGRILKRQACYLPVVDVPSHSGPFIGCTNVDNLYLASGHSCWGINNAPATGLLMSEILLDGEATSASVDGLEPEFYFDASLQ